MLDFMDAGSFVVGVDISAEMLMSADEVIRDCYEDDDYIPAILIQKDIAEFCLSVKFDLIYCMGDTLNYLSREKMEKTFNNVKKMLKEGSAFIVDVINPEHFMTDVPEEETITLHDKTKITFLRCLKLSHPYMTTGKTIALTRQTFVGKIMSLLFNMLSKLVIAFRPRSKQVSFHFMVAVTICSDFGAPKNKV